MLVDISLFQFLTITNKATMNIYMKAILCICFYLEMKFAVSRSSEAIIFIRKSQPGFQRGLCNFTLLTSLWSSDSSTSFSTLVIINFLKFHYYCGFHSISLIFMMLNIISCTFSHLYFFFGEISGQGIDYLKNWLVFLT